MEFVRGYFAFNALAIIGCCLVFYARRRLWKRRQRLGKPNPGFFPTYTSAGNALQTLQAMTQQRVEYVLEEKFDDEADDDEEGGPPDPTKHLQRQLRRIGRGEKVDKLTAISLRGSLSGPATKTAVSDFPCFKPSDPDGVG